MKIPQELLDRFRALDMATESLNTHQKLTLYTLVNMRIDLETKKDALWDEMFAACSVEPGGGKAYEIDLDAGELLETPEVREEK